MPDLSKRATDDEREREGVLFTGLEVPELTFRLIGKGHPGASFAYGLAYREVRLERDEPPAANDPDVWARFVAWFVRDWFDARSEADAAKDPVTLDGQPLTYSPERARELLRRLPRLREELYVAVEARGLFRPPAYDLQTDEGGQGNSPPSSSGAGADGDGTNHGSET